MHTEMSDTVPQTLLPAYITRASDNGRFRIDNIAAGEYKLYGLKDDNNNKKYDLPTETFAFLDSSIYISAANNYIPPRPDSILVEPDSTLVAPVDSTLVTPVIDTTEVAEDSLRYERIPGKEYELYYFVAENKIQSVSYTHLTLPTN